MATNAQYTAQPILEYAQVTTADTSRTAPTNVVEITAGPNTAAGNGVGKRIMRVTIQSTATTTAGVIRFFLSLDSGTTDRLICEKIVPAVTPSTSVAAWRTEVAELVGLILPGGTANKIYATTNNTETFNIIVESGLL
jgi:type IV pilus biogenesis protein CpaD/CtpE